jgi:molybdate transport system substrate-binding protein
MRRVFANAGVLIGLLFPLGFVVSCRAPESAAVAGEVRVAAAADLKFALDDVLKGFRERRPDIDVKVTYGSSGNFFAQLTNRAPFDLFLSADVDYPRKLAAQGFADPGSEFLYAVGHLVVWVPKASPLAVERLGAAALLEPAARKIAIANPKHAPYGRAAEEALKSLHIYDQVKDRLVLGDNIAQTAQFVQSGAADVGIIALSLALAPTLRDAGRYWEVPPGAHARLEQGGVILSWAQDRPAAEALRTYLLGGEARAVLKRYGFVLPGE